MVVRDIENELAFKECNKTQNYSFSTTKLGEKNCRKLHFDLFQPFLGNKHLSPDVVGN